MLAQRRSAYTVMELVITVGVLAVLTAFIIPTYQLILSQLQLNSAVQEVADFMRLAQQKTVTEQQIYGVTLTAGATTIPLFLYDPLTAVKSTQTTLTIPANVSISAVNFSGVSDVRFTTSGAPSTSGNIVLTDTIRNRNRTVEIRPSGNILNNTGEF
jgi:type II secretory pathway pseudopilin PulG